MKPLRLALLIFVTLLPVVGNAQPGGTGGNGGRPRFTLNPGMGNALALICYWDPGVYQRVRDYYDRASRGDAPLSSTFDRHINRVDLRWPPVMAEYYEMAIELNGGSRLRSVDAQWGQDFADGQLDREILRMQNLTGEHYARLEAQDPRFWTLIRSSVTGRIDWTPTPWSEIPNVYDARLPDYPVESCLYLPVAALTDTPIRAVALDREIYALMDDNNRRMLFEHEDATHFYRLGQAQCLYEFNQASWTIPLTAEDRRGCLEAQQWNTDIARRFVIHLNLHPHEIQSGNWNSIAEGLSLHVERVQEAGRPPRLRRVYSQKDVAVGGR